jgi:hypothetical protein
MAEDAYLSLLPELLKILIDCLDAVVVACDHANYHHYKVRRNTA